MKLKIGQLVYLPVEVKPGMFPTEVRFYGQFLNKTISGFTSEAQIVHNKNLRTVVIEVTHDSATLALPGEVAQAKVLEVPIAFARQHIAYSA